MIERASLRRAADLRDDLVNTQRIQINRLLRLVRVLAGADFAREQPYEYAPTLRAAVRECVEAGLEGELPADMLTPPEPITKQGKPKKLALEIATKLYPTNQNRYRLQRINAARIAMGKLPLTYRPLKGKWHEHV